MSCNCVHAAAGTPGLSVSIPIGFSNELQLPGAGRGPARTPGFNPYRVFQ